MNSGQNETASARDRASGKSVEFFFWKGCPSHVRALADLRVAMADLGLDSNELSVVEIKNDLDAETTGFPGSPTIRVLGRDVQDPGDNPVALTCRLYRHRDGRPSPLPDPQDLRDALAELVGARHSG